MFSNLKCVIPARFNSTRLPGKPLADINGKPMIVRVCERVSASLSEVELVVATDDERIGAALGKAGFDYEMTAQTHDSGSDRVFEVAEKRAWPENSIILNVQGDEPLIPATLLKEFIKFIDDNNGFDVWTVTTSFDSVDEVFDKHKVKALTDRASRALYFSRLPVPYHRDRALCAGDLVLYQRHVGLYAYSLQALKTFTRSPQSSYELAEKLEQLRMLELGLQVGVHRYKGVVPHGVDTYPDLDLVNRLFRNTDESY